MKEVNTLLKVENLSKHFPVRGGVLNREVDQIKAVDGVSFSIPRGKTLGLVGESGSGKTTVGRCVIRLIEPTSGSIVFDGVDLTTLSKHDMRMQRSHMQMIYQSPAASLNARMTVGDIIAEPLWTHQNMRGATSRNKVMELLTLVGLKEDYFYRFPHEFSGGQQQRIGIARALAVDPQMLILDEPTSALDVSVQAQVLNLLQGLQDRFGLTFLFVSHDLGVVRYVSDEVALMYLGKLVEIADDKTIFEEPKHPYTQALISAIPEPDPTSNQKQIVLEGDIEYGRPRQGCPFAPRCHAAKLAICETVEPQLVDTGDGHMVACHLHPAKAG